MSMSIPMDDHPLPNALQIRPLTHPEAGKLSQTEYERVTAVLEQLNGDDWQQQTYCTAWNVRQMVAHLAGGVTGSTSFAEFKRQNISHPYVKEAAESIDGTNRLQVEERADRTTAELIQEFRQNGQIAVNNRKRLPWLIRKIRVPMGSQLGLTSFEYLMDVIYPRDEWMHRYDICAATGKEMVITAEHDGRLMEIVFLDVARKLKKLGSRQTIALQATGPLAFDYQFGEGKEPDCLLSIDLFDFNLRASGRITAEEALAKSAVTGDTTAAKWFLQNIEIAY